MLNHLVTVFRFQSAGGTWQRKRKNDLSSWKCLQENGADSKVCSHNGDIIYWPGKRLWRSSGIKPRLLSCWAAEMWAEILIGEGLYIKTVMSVSTEFSKACPVGSGLGLLPSPTVSLNHSSCSGAGVELGALCSSWALLCLTQGSLISAIYKPSHNCPNIYTDVYFWQWFAVCHSHYDYEAAFLCSWEVFQITCLLNKQMFHFLQIVTAAFYENKGLIMISPFVYCKLKNQNVTKGMFLQQ